jgi:hypothetical protein
LHDAAGVVGEWQRGGAFVPSHVVRAVAAGAAAGVVEDVLRVPVHVLRQHGAHCNPDALNAAD